MKPCIVWQTDFSLKWGAVASMRGVCKQVDPTLECVDITHEIEPYNIFSGSQEIAYVEPFWPKGRSRRRHLPPRLRRQTEGR